MSSEHLLNGHEESTSEYDYEPRGQKSLSHRDQLNSRSLLKKYKILPSQSQTQVIQAQAEKSLRMLLQSNSRKIPIKIIEQQAVKHLGKVRVQQIMAEVGRQSPSNKQMRAQIAENASSRNNYISKNRTKSKSSTTHYYDQSGSVSSLQNTIGAGSSPSAIFPRAKTNRIPVHNSKPTQPAPSSHSSRPLNQPSIHSKSASPSRLSSKSKSNSSSRRQRPSQNQKQNQGSTARASSHLRNPIDLILPPKHGIYSAQIRGATEMLSHTSADTIDKLFAKADILIEQTKRQQEIDKILREKEKKHIRFEETKSSMVGEGSIEERGQQRVSARNSTDSKTEESHENDINILTCLKNYGRNSPQFDLMVQTYWVYFVNKYNVKRVTNFMTQLFSSLEMKRTKRKVEIIYDQGQIQPPETSNAESQTVGLYKEEEGTQTETSSNKNIPFNVKAFTAHVERKDQKQRNVTLYQNFSNDSYKSQVNQKSQELLPAISPGIPQIDALSTPGALENNFPFSSSKTPEGTEQNSKQNVSHQKLLAHLKHQQEVMKSYGQNRTHSQILPDSSSGVEYGGTRQPKNFSKEKIFSSPQRSNQNIQNQAEEKSSSKFYSTIKGLDLTQRVSEQVLNELDTPQVNEQNRALNHSQALFINDGAEIIAQDNKLFRGGSKSSRTLSSHVNDRYDKDKDENGSTRHQDGPEIVVKPHRHAQIETHNAPKPEQSTLQQQQYPLNSQEHQPSLVSVETSNKPAELFYDGPGYSSINRNATDFDLRLQKSSQLYHDSLINATRQIIMERNQYSNMRMDSSANNPHNLAILKKNFPIKDYQSAALEERQNKRNRAQRALYEQSWRPLNNQNNFKVQNGSGHNVNKQPSMEQQQSNNNHSADLQESKKSSVYDQAKPWDIANPGNRFQLPKVPFKIVSHTVEISTLGDNF